jgi:uncharacterized Zn finger protein (UPF0148 family)
MIRKCQACGANLNIGTVGEESCPYCGTLNVIQEEKTNAEKKISVQLGSKTFSASLNGFENRSETERSEVGHHILVHLVLLFVFPFFGNLIYELSYQNKHRKK